MNYLTIHIEGGLLSPDFLDGLPEAAGQRPVDFGLGKRSLVDEVTAVWADVATYWKAFQIRLARAQDGRGESITTITREQWVIPLLEALGYDIVFQRKAAEVDGRTYTISHRAGGTELAPPIHIVAIDQKLGDRPPSGRGRLSPHALLQDYLNRSDEHLWGIVTNGAILRLLRDSTYFTRPSYIEFDLEQMLAGERLDEFFLLYRLAQRSRLPVPGTPAEDCLLEQYYQETIDQGGRIRDGLRAAVAGAIITFANGFLHHPSNEDLRGKIKDGRLSDVGFYQQLLYLIYRLLFLMVAEERNLLETENGNSSYYRDYFSVARLRTLASQPLSAPQRFDDLYMGWRTLCRAFHDEAMAAQLGVPPLNGKLFRELPDLDNAWLNNRDLLTAIRNLSHFTTQDEQVRRRVNYGALDVEELGSVYESLLDEQPLVTLDTAGRLPQFSFVSGMERKTTGSYYTPRELVNEVIKSALVPVIEDRLQQAGNDQKAREQALLGMNVCDPACGSGHFLLAAARRIGYELARVRSGADEPAPEGTRAATREVITHCIYGVDKNPLAVDLCKVALWIEGHSRGKPLTFLDYRIRCGDSLVGVLDMGVIDEGIPDNAFKAVSGDDKKLAASLRKQNKVERAGQMSLFDQLDTQAELPNAGQWQALENLPEDTPKEIDAKRAAYEQLHTKANTVRTAADLWTAAFFSTITQKNLPHIPTTETLRRYRQDQNVSAQIVGLASGLSEKLRFFHWPLEFPHVFANGGFAAILGNPPWERIKLQDKEFFATRDPEIINASTAAQRKRLIAKLSTSNPILWEDYQRSLHNADCLSKFARVSDRFPLTAVGDINTYTLFAETGRYLISEDGRAGIICPPGIASDSTTQGFFKDLMRNKSLVSLVAFVNEKMIFPAVLHNFRFCIFTMAGSNWNSDGAKFAYECQTFEDMLQEERYYTLTIDDLRLLNPNTQTAPVFWSSTDAELSKKIYQRIPVLVNENYNENYWNISFLRMFDMSNDSKLFKTELVSGYERLYEAKMFYHYDHRFGSYSKTGGERKHMLPSTTQEEYANPDFTAKSHYYVPIVDVNARLEKKWTHQWLISFRGIAIKAGERAATFTILPKVGVANSAPILLINETSPIRISCLLASLNSLVFDYLTKQKISGANFNFFIIKQLPVLPPKTYSNWDVCFIVPKLLELVYTAWDIASFAADIWDNGGSDIQKLIHSQWKENEYSTGGFQFSAKKPDLPLTPFKWNEERRAQIRAELDAYYARLYGLTRDELRYILDPMEIYGPDFPGETFRVLKEKEIRDYGEFRTQRLVLAAWDAQQAAINSGEMPWDHPVPDPSIVGPKARPAQTDTSQPKVAEVPKPAIPSKSKTPSRPQKKKAAPPATLQQLSIPQVHLPDLSIAAEGGFNQRLKRVQKLSKEPTPAEIAELAVYLAAPENSIRWFAGASLAQVGGANAVAAIESLLNKSIKEETQQEALGILSQIASDGQEVTSTRDYANKILSMNTADQVDRTI